MFALACSARLADRETWKQTKSVRPLEHAEDNRILTFYRWHGNCFRDRYL